MLEGIIEVDETFIGRKMKKYKPYKNNTNKGRSTSSKTSNRNGKSGGKVISKTIESPRKEHVMPFLIDYISSSSSVVTDGSILYHTAKEHFEKHMKISHSTGVFKRGICHANIIEGVWSQLKRAILGQYHKITEQYLQLYLDEICFKYNHRTNPDGGYSLLIRQML